MAEWVATNDELKIKLINAAYHIFDDAYANDQVANYLDLPLATLISEMKRLEMWCDEAPTEANTPTTEAPPTANVNAAAAPPEANANDTNTAHTKHAPAPNDAIPRAVLPVVPKSNHWTTTRKFAGPDGVRRCDFFNSKTKACFHYWQLQDGLFSSLRCPGDNVPSGLKNRAAWLQREEFSPTGEEPRVGCPMHHGYPEVKIEQPTPPPPTGRSNLSLLPARPTQIPHVTRPGEDEDENDDHRGPDEEPEDDGNGKLNS